MTWDVAVVIGIVATAVLLAIRSLRQTVKTGATACGCAGSGSCQGGSSHCGHAPLTQVGKHEQQ